jgi:predicted MFS family arabinose efflux permease
MGVGTAGSPHELVTAPVGALIERAAERAGGRARARVIALLACVLALDSADKGTVGAVAAELEHSLRIGHVAVGAVATVSAIVGALATLPVGALTDRVRRVRLLWISIVFWCVAMLAVGAAPSLGALLVSRVALGAVTATAGPTLASLIGDLFPPGERARVWGVILSGELIGAGIGLVGSGEVAGALSWRWGFWWLIIPGLALAHAIRGGLDEPPRTQADPRRISLARAVRCVVRVRTNVVLVVASSLGYFFFAGVQVFAVVLLRNRYDLSQTTASALLGLVGVGAVTGAVAGGRLADRLMAGGRRTARITVAVGANALSVAALAPALLSHVLAVSLPLYVLGAAALSAGNAPLNAARLDIMPANLWGRAEAVRTVAQMAAVAAAPLLFGLVAHALGGHALGTTFVIMLVPLAASAFILRLARRTYPADARTARSRGQPSRG